MSSSRTTRSRCNQSASARGMGNAASSYRGWRPVNGLWLTGLTVCMTAPRLSLSSLTTSGTYRAAEHRNAADLAQARAAGAAAGKGAVAATGEAAAKAGVQVTAERLRHPVRHNDRGARFDAAD